MKFRGSITKLEDTGEGVAFTVQNVRQKGAAGWREYSGPLVFKTTNAQAKPFTVGRAVEIDVKVKG